MQDHSHRLLFLALTGLMSAAAFYGSEAGPTLLVGNDAASQAANVTVSVPNEDPIVAKLTTDGTCPQAASEPSAFCLAKSKISLSGP